jgi:2-keto-3-deoxy-L-rhamnonate aldolase RhmA
VLIFFRHFFSQCFWWIGFFMIQKPMLVPKVHRRWGFQAQALARDLNTTTGLLARQALLKERLASGEQLYGAFSVSFSPIVAEILGWAQYDFVVVDMEHGPGGTMAALPVLQVLASTGTPAILRLPANDPMWAKKALDLGPAGIMFPMIENANAAQNAVRACRYPPKGIRGAAFPIVRAARYGLDYSYLDRCEAEELLIMCQVESVEAVKNIPEIAAVEGVDCIQMGPLDLRADMGLLGFPTDSSPSNLLREAEEMVKSTGVYLCGFATADDSPSALMELGYDMVSGAVDVGLLRNAAVADVQQHKQKTKKKKKLDNSKFSKIL